MQSLSRPTARPPRLASWTAPRPTPPTRLPVAAAQRKRDSSPASSGSWDDVQPPYKTLSGTTSSTAIVRAPTAGPSAPTDRRGELLDDGAASDSPANSSPSPFTALLRWWAELPAQYKITVATSLSFVICNMDKVNISVAILAMSRDFGWSPTISGLVQSSFFYGYLLSQIPGGYASSLLGGRKVLPAGVAVWSAATAAVPVLAGTLPGLFLSRALVGLGEGVAPSAATDIVARSIPTEQRSRAISFVFGGLHVGSLLGLLIAPACIERFGWPSVFYLFGGVGLLWTVWWERLMVEVSAQDPELGAALLGSGGTSNTAKQEGQAEADAGTAGHGGHGGVIDAKQPVSLLPPIAAIAASALAGPSADALIARGVPVVTVRKAAQSIAFLGPAACLLAASQLEGSLASVALVTMSLGLASFSLAGLYCNHADLSPRYASVLLGMTNTSGALPGIVGVAFTGLLFDFTGSWGWSLFAPSIFFFLTGTAAYLKWGSASPQDYGEVSNSEPFAVERWLGLAKSTDDDKADKLEAMAAQQQSAAQQAPQQQQLYPPPPPFYRLYIADADGSAERPLPPLPPPPLTGNYQQFGIADSTEVVLPPLTGRQLFQAKPDGSIDYKQQLLALHRELAANLLELLSVLVDKPSMWARQVENTSAVLRNMQHLCNLIRPVQARQTLVHTLAAELQERRQAVQELRDKVAQADTALAGSAEELATAAAALRQAADEAAGVDLAANGAG
ncbi:putative anion transporter 6 [Chlorella vulgaris]